jgi:hypothetical protein
MRNRKGFAVAISFVALLLLAPGSFPGGGAAEDAGKAGWEEGTPGRWNSLPQTKTQADKDFFRAEVALAPGTGVLWEKKTNRTLQPGDTLSIDMVSTGTNRTSRDYRRYDAHFPISVTVVFGRDFESLTWKKRVADFFRAVWNGFHPGGIRLTFAYGNVVPVGSMYRMGEEETVFILAGEEEQGKRINFVRDLRDDFRAAYGRDPKGPVTRILVSAERPSRESGPIQSEIGITSPLLR